MFNCLFSNCNDWFSSTRCEAKDSSSDVNCSVGGRGKVDDATDVEVGRLISENNWDVSECGSLWISSLIEK
jgi:hypothetical protein